MCMYSTSIKQHNRGWTLFLKELTNYCGKLENKERRRGKNNDLHFR